MKKPDDEIFQTVIKEASLMPNETIFIDDLEVNCKLLKETEFKHFRIKNLMIG